MVSDFEDDEDAGEGESELEIRFEKLMEEIEAGADPTNLVDTIEFLDDLCDQEMRGLQEDIDVEDDPEVKSWLQDELEGYQEIKNALTDFKNS